MSAAAHPDCSRPSSKAGCRCCVAARGKVLVPAKLHPAASVAAAATHRSCAAIAEAAAATGTADRLLLISRRPAWPAAGAATPPPQRQTGPARAAAAAARPRPRPRPWCWSPTQWMSRRHTCMARTMSVGRPFCHRCGSQTYSSIGMMVSQPLSQQGQGRFIMCRRAQIPADSREQGEERAGQRSSRSTGWCCVEDVRVLALNDGANSRGRRAIGVEQHICQPHRLSRVQTNEKRTPRAR